MSSLTTLLQCKSCGTMEAYERFSLVNPMMCSGCMKPTYHELLPDPVMTLRKRPVQPPARRPFNLACLPVTLFWIVLAILVWLVLSSISIHEVTKTTPEPQNRAVAGDDGVPDDLCGLDTVLCSNERIATITMYSPVETCPDRPCITASGRIAEEGITVACPYDIPLGASVVIDGREYRCDDRTSRWIQERNGATFDVFTNDYENAIEWGRRPATSVIVL